MRLGAHLTSCLRFDATRTTWRFWNATRKASLVSDNEEEEEEEVVHDCALAHYRGTDVKVVDT
jgi:hypothetical protein